MSRITTGMSDGQIFGQLMLSVMEGEAEDIAGDLEQEGLNLSRHNVIWTEEGYFIRLESGPFTLTLPIELVDGNWRVFIDLPDGDDCVRDTVPAQDLANAWARLARLNRWFTTEMSLYPGSLRRQVPAESHRVEFRVVNFDD